jgi:hypothetical protein
MAQTKTLCRCLLPELTFLLPCLPLPCATEAFSLGATPTTREAQAVADEIFADFVSAEVDKVELVFTKFVSLISSNPTIQTLLPLSPSGELCDVDGNCVDPAEDELFKLTTQVRGERVGGAGLVYGDGGPRHQGQTPSLGAVQAKSGSAAWASVQWLRLGTLVGKAGALVQSSCAGPASAWGNVCVPGVYAEWLAYASLVVHLCTPAGPHTSVWIHLVRSHLLAAASRPCGA